MNNFDNATYGRMFDELIYRYAPKSDKPLTVEEWKHVTYWLKVLDLLWFEDLPGTLEEEFKFCFNKNWPNPVDHPEELLELGRLGLPELIHLSGRLDKPSWATETPQGSFTLRLYLEIWQSMLDGIQNIEKIDRKVTENE